VAHMRKEDINSIDPSSLRSWRFWLHAPNFFKLYYRLFNDKRVALLPKVILVVGILYVISPEDFIPDILAPLGLLDDAVIITLVLRGFIGLCPRNVVDEHVTLISEGT
jgi:uncharacterized membrane protein YkvA (DUF1232 family)